jgi:hypothetical protein
MLGTGLLTFTTQTTLLGVYVSQIILYGDGTEGALLLTFATAYTTD